MKKLALVRREGVALDPAIEREFSAVNQYRAAAQQDAVHGACAMVMEGVELTRLHGIYGVRPGNRHTQAAVNSASVAELGISWADILNTYGGYSETTARRRMDLAGKAEGTIKLIEGFLSAGKPFAALPDAAKAALAEAFQISLGRAMPKQLCFELGLGAKPQEAGGYRPSKEEVAAFLADQHPDLQGKTYEELPEKIQREFRKWLAGRPEAPKDVIARANALADNTVGVLAQTICAPWLKGVSAEKRGDLKLCARKLIDKLDELERPARKTHTP